MSRAKGRPLPPTARNPLRADQLFDAPIGALGIKNIDIQQPARSGAESACACNAALRGEFNRTFGYDPSERRDEVASSIPQALVMMNSPVVNRAINARNGQSVLGDILAETKDDEAVATELYLRCLAREPKPEELKTCSGACPRDGQPRHGLRGHPLGAAGELDGVFASKIVMSGVWCVMIDE